MGTALNDMKTAFLIASEGAEQSELLHPWQALSAQGARPVLVCPKPGEAQLFDHLDRGRKVPVDVVLADADPGEFDALVLPGGVANPDFLRMQQDAVKFVGSFFAARRPVAAICHAPWLLVEADEVRGRTLTSWPSLRTDITNAGGKWVDEQVVVCDRGSNLLITSRKPQDLPAFSETTIKQFSRVRV
jgi:protease I